MTARWRRNSLAGWRIFTNVVTGTINVAGRFTRETGGTFALAASHCWEGSSTLTNFEMNFSGDVLFYTATWDSDNCGRFSMYAYTLTRR